MEIQWNEAQLEYLQKHFPDIDFQQPLSDDDFFRVDEFVKDDCIINGFDDTPADPYKINPLGRLAESIIDLLEKG